MGFTAMNLLSLGGIRLLGSQGPFSLLVKTWAVDWVELGSTLSFAGHKLCEFGYFRYLTFLILSILISKVGLIIIPSSRGYCNG